MPRSKKERELGPFGPKPWTRERWVEERKKYGAKLLKAEQRRRGSKRARETSELDTGTLIEAIRMAKGLTQVELADKVGCTQKHICNLENGISVNVAMLERIAKAAGATLRLEFIP